MQLKDDNRAERYKIDVMQGQVCQLTIQEIARLRTLAAQVAEIATRPEQSHKAKLWTIHNDLKTTEPLALIDPENGWHEIITEKQLLCTSPLGRQWEFHLLREIFWADHLKDDRVVDAIFDVPHSYVDTGWGVKVERIGGQNGGAYHVKQAIEDYEEDFKKIHFPKIVVDFDKSQDMLNLAHHVFDGLLHVRQKTSWWWSLGLTWSYIDLRGLEDFMCDFILEPEWVHRMMELLCQGTLDRIDYLSSQGLLSLNTGNSYVGSGGYGFTDQLPKDGALDRFVKPMDMWGFVESQETVSVSPEMYGEFIFPYHKRIAERFGLNCFGCCEPYEARFKYARQLPRLRRVSCSPWSDRRKTSELLGMNYVASHKLSPTPLSMPVMNEDEVRMQIRSALENSRNCVPELVMKDNHTLGNNPRNATRWVEIVREEISNL